MIVLFRILAELNAQPSSKTPGVNHDVFSVVILLLPMAPLVIILGGIVVFGRSIYSWIYRAHWSAQTQLQWPHSAEFDDARCVVSTHLSRNEYKWDYFPGFRESPYRNFYCI